MSKVVMQTIVSVDGFIATDDDQVGPLFDWFGTGDRPLYENGPLVTGRSYDYYRPMLDAIGALVVGRHVFDITDGWGGRPPAGDHCVVVSHRPAPDGWDTSAPFHFVDDVSDAVRLAKELAGDRTVSIAAGDVGGQIFEAGLVDEVALDVVPVVFGTGKRYFGRLSKQVLLEDPDEVVQGDRVLHLRFRVRK
ncbi:dihydrofolate reductase [Pseudonocardia hierapolitana]|uniref:Dihydrofolate reductase n=1 Tax=Pseudonocardia hierapolitana TaxID=1128676 RepID=A0A561SRZ8_9PSEU|nr:dihydrofolate reductase family protein [Pseudonocardia hierapolitana]TWF77658.1 dihydrofolate reductase [Pseudonocardia hierapolitana]